MHERRNQRTTTKWEKKQAAKRNRRASHSPTAEQRTKKCWIKELEAVCCVWPKARWNDREKIREKNTVFVTMSFLPRLQNIKCPSYHTHTRAPRHIHNVSPTTPLAPFRFTTTTRCRCTAITIAAAATTTASAYIYIRNGNTKAESTEKFFSRRERQH